MDERGLRPPPVLLGRDRELDELSRLLERARHDGAALLLLGEPGAGKSACLRALAGLARGAGSQVLEAAGVEFEADLAFAGLHQLVLPLEAALERLDRAHRDGLRTALGRGGGPSPDPLLVCDATLRLLRAAAAERPLLVLVDDLAWMDPPSATVVGFAARRIAGTRIGIVAACRTEDLGGLEAAGIPELTLPPLDDAAAAALVRRHHPHLSDHSVGEIVHEARGNALALVELPRLSGRPVSHPGRSPELSLRRRLQQLFAGRVHELARSTRRLLLLVALEGTGDPRLLEATDGSPGRAEDLEIAEAAGLLCVDAHTRRLDFPHPLVRAAVVALASDRERRDAHRELAVRYVDEPIRRAWHRAEAQVGPDEHVAGLLEEAARELRRRGDIVGARTLWLRAAELSGSAGGKRRRLAEAAYLEADVAGQLRAASGLLADARRTATDLPPSLQEAVASAHLLMNGDGDLDAAHRLARDALARHLDERGQGNPPDGDDLDEAFYTLLLTCFFSASPEAWRDHFALLGRLAGPVPATVALSGALLADPRSTARTALGELEREIEHLTEAIEPSRVLRIALAASLVDRLPACRAALRRVVEEAKVHGMSASRANAQMLLGRDLFWSGQPDEATALLEGAVAWCDAQGYTLLSWPGRHVRGLVSAIRGNDADADAVASAMLRWATPRHAGLVACYAAQLQSLAALGQGDFESAYRAACKISPPGELAPFVPYALLVQLDLVEAAWRTGRRVEAERHARAVEAAGIDGLSARLALLARASAAVVADDARAEQRFAEALATPGAASFPFDQARVQLLWGERRRRLKAPGSARGPLLAALETFERLGATPWAARTAAELRATGSAGGRVGAPGWHELTPQEQEIAQLAARGLTNKQIGERLFLSHRTVSSHLYRIFPKLGITSRAALRDALGPPSPSPR